ncbi:hypothetical protein OPV22_024894 [Ensete ventricosum]|uniref:Uncharacterized protein n=1 Tax=Ensete ventricosum TaxID=4639 RepID=A0AAV8P6V5_ENSVE|nr:hypothetical protein OPV22_024894 [Ensete ventricosum]
MCHMRWMIPHSRDENTSWSLPGALLLRPLTSMKPRVMVAYQICLVQNNHVISWDPLFHAKDTRDWTPSSSYEGHMQMTNFRVPAGSFPPPHPCDEDVDTRPLASGSVSSLPVAVDHIVMCPRQPVMGTSQHNQKAAPTVCQCRCSQPNGIFFIGCRFQGIILPWKFETKDSLNWKIEGMHKDIETTNYSSPVGGGSSMSSPFHVTLS